MPKPLFSVYGRATPDHESGPILVTAKSAIHAANLGNLIYGQQHNLSPRCFETLRIVEHFVPEEYGQVFEINDGEIFHVNPDGSVCTQALYDKLKTAMEKQFS